MSQSHGGSLFGCSYSQPELPLICRLFVLKKTVPLALVLFLFLIVFVFLTTLAVSTVLQESTLWFCLREIIARLDPILTEKKKKLLRITLLTCNQSNLQVPPSRWK